MERYTHERLNGIQNGYWSPNKKQELVDRLAAYENAELDPEQIQEMKERDMAKKIEINAGIPICPVCGRRIVKCYDFCPGCRQRMEQ